MNPFQEPIEWKRTKYYLWCALCKMY